jgi:hypothetical protein
MEFRTQLGGDAFNFADTAGFGWVLNLLQEGCHDG